MRGAVEPQGVTCYDFGTAFSKVAVCRSGFVSKPLPIGTVGGSERPFGVPSLVFHDSGSVYLGAPALARLTGAPDQRLRKLKKKDRWRHHAPINQNLSKLLNGSN